MQKDTLNYRNIFCIAGAFISWVIGSGFATGQEVLQFFSSYGYESYLIIGINLVGFLLIGTTLLSNGYRHKNETDFEQFAFYCGKKLGNFYSWLISLTLLLIMAVLISGAGAMLHEYYGLNHYVGALIMAVAVLVTHFIGFERLIKVLAFTGPSIVVFCLIIGVITMIRDIDAFASITEYELALAKSQPSDGWLLSAVLYVSYNILGGSVYYTQLGKTANHVKEAKIGAVLGSVFLILAITVINTAILLNGEVTATLSIPNLYLAKRISWLLGAVFSVFLVMGIFSSCSAMMWTVCSKFTRDNKKKDHGMAVVISIGTFILGLFPFGGLIGVFYPIVGYLGLIYLACVLIKQLKKGDK